MKHFSRIATALLLAVVLTVPMVSTASAIGNSDTIRKDLTADRLGQIQLNASDINVVLKATDDSPYAELDATVVGIDSAQVTYSLNVTDTDLTGSNNDTTNTTDSNTTDDNNDNTDNNTDDNSDNSTSDNNQVGGIVIEAMHDGETVIGIDRVTLTLYVPADAINTLELNLTDSDLRFDDVNVNELTGTMTGSKLSVMDTHIQKLSLNATDSDINLAGEVREIDLEAKDGTSKITSTVLPTDVKVTASNNNVDLKIPDDSQGFKATYTMNKGSFRNDFVNDYDQDGGDITYGNGSSTFEFNMTDSNINLTK